MPHSDISFRAAAEECRSLAAKTIDPVKKQELQRAADDWLRLAQVAGVASPTEPEHSSVAMREPSETNLATADRD